MSLFGSLFSGVSSLTAQSKAMSMISDNVANVNTTAYKGANAQFSSLVTRQPSSLSYAPGGVRAFTKYDVESQGLIQSSSSPTDVAVSGAGFFVVNSQSDDNVASEQFYTRDGAFTPDFFGNLRTPSGFYLQGWVLDNNEEIVDVNALETVNIRQVNGVATSTTTVDMGANLNADQVAYTGAPAYTAGAMADYTAGIAGGIQPHFTRDIQIYDSLGRPQDVTAAFLREGAANTWRIEVFSDPANLDAGVHGANGLIASDTFSFNTNGSVGTLDFSDVGDVVLAGPNGDAAIRWAAAIGAEDNEIAFDFGTAGTTTGLTQFASPTNVAYVTQNGAEVGELNGVSIDEQGYVSASFTNGETRKLYRLPVATFANPSQLDPRSGNIYAQTDVAGEYNLRFAGTGGAGSLSPASLEAANVDLAEEFTKMIVTQRAYSASARVITTTDQMLDDLIRISG